MDSQLIPTCQNALVIMLGVSDAVIQAALEIETFAEKTAKLDADQRFKFTVLSNPLNHPTVQGQNRRCGDHMTRSAAGCCSEQGEVETKTI